MSGSMMETRTIQQRSERTGGVASAYLLVFESGSSRLVVLPARGEITIGRVPEVDLQLDHPSVSRRHARIAISERGLQLADLGSHNGTQLNGQAITETRALAAGDTIGIGDVTLVLHAEAARALAPEVLDEHDLRRRLAEEVQRAISYRRSLAILAIEGSDREPVDCGLRSIDILGVDRGQLLIVLPEADATAAATLAAMIVRATAPRTKIGIATCPSDATDPANLVLAARAALKVAPVGGVALAREAAERRELGERQVLLAHPTMVRAFALLERLAASTLPVLIVGETGVGKEHAAFAIHYYSARRERAFVALNCAALPETLVESQLFGHVRGAFTGATATQQGVFEAASGGTLFLDELGELPLATQAKLLRALETQRITRVGETDERVVDVRLVAATNRNLDDEISAGRFRQDLYFRLGAARVHLPPLRDRRSEIPHLFHEFVRLAALRECRTAPEASSAVMERLIEHAWPGNVRELKHVADFVVAICEDDRIELEDLPSPLGIEVPVIAREPQTAMTLADEIAALERRRMVEALERANGVKTKAAASLGMPIRTFSMKVRQHGLKE